jgi:hypothetical protein
MKRHIESWLAFIFWTALIALALYGLIVPVRWGGQR